VVSDITNIDSSLQSAAELLESARGKGYAYQADLEGCLYDSMGQWETIRPQVSSIIQQQGIAIQGQIAGVNPMVQNLNRVIANPAMGPEQIRSTQSYVNNLLGNVSRVESDLHTRYGPVESQAQKLNARLKDIHWALDQLAQAKFSLQNGEDLVMAVPNRWDKEGKDDPEGVLYLSNRRLIFERKEKVATKKVLFITTASELVQEVLIDQPLSNLSDVKAENKGLFGHQDFLMVTFTEARLGTVAFHINGQDSKDWAAWVERARSGQIEAERTNAGAGLSIADLNKPLTQADVLALQTEVNALQDEVMLKSTRQELARLENDVHSLERKLAELRAHGYLIEKDLEADITILAAQWDRVKRNAESTIEYQTKALGEQMAAIQSNLAQVVGLSANLAAARPAFMQVKSSIASVQAQADAAEATIFTQYDEYADEVESMQAHLEWVDWMLKAISTASFRLLATESGVAAVEAVFMHPTWEPENGVFFLTDQRILWEDRVGTYELKVDVPLQGVLEVTKEAIAGNESEVLMIRFGPTGPLPEARFQLSLPVADDWIQMVGRARGGGYAEDRAVALAPEELARIRNAPQACQNCGAAFTAPILRGQTDIHCEYCGKVTHL
jgi:ABC-type transporter Mla subunit MlaD